MFHTSCYPQSNGLVERAKGLLKRNLEPREACRGTRLLKLLSQLNDWYGPTGSPVGRAFFLKTEFSAPPTGEKEYHAKLQAGLCLTGYLRFVYSTTSNPIAKRVGWLLAPAGVFWDEAFSCAWVVAHLCLRWGLWTEKGWGQEIALALALSKNIKKLLNKAFCHTK